MNISLRGILALAASLALVRGAGAAWQTSEHALAWEHDGRTVWQFNSDPQFAKTFFHPLTAGGGPDITESRPDDHRWHYGLWFSWKYINKANYWEENRETGKSEGATRWSPPRIETQPDGAATISFDLTYANPSGRVDLTEKRSLSARENMPSASTPWYLANSDTMHWANPAVLAPAEKHLAAGGKWRLRYRIIVRPAVWTAEDLRAALAVWKQDWERDE